MEIFWIFVGGVLYGLLTLAAGVLLDKFLEARRRGATPDDDPGIRDWFRTYRDRWKDAE